VFYRMTGGFGMMQCFPGEAFGGTFGPASGLDIHGSIPTDYYSHPENYGFPDAPNVYSFTEERRASPALYEYRPTNRPDNDPFGADDRLT
jgi:hypothetical protein